MSQITNAFDTYEAIGNREDLADIIYNISPTQTPFLSAVGKRQISNVQFDWQTEVLPTPSSTGQLEGFELSKSTSTNTTRATNVAMISSRDATVTGSQEATDTAGKNSEMAHQLAIMAKALKRDMEEALTQNIAKNAGNVSTARQTRSLETWYATNVNKASDGANGSDSAARTNGTRRDLTEAMVKDVQQQCFASGAEPSILMVGPYNKSVISGFTGRSQARQFVDANTIEASVSIYSGDFGELQVVPSNRSREQAVHLLDPEYAAVAYLRDFETIDIATVGDAETKMLLVEYGLEMRNEAAHGIVADVKVSDSDAG
tara:strand:- start:652 stop:1602 length:951 start_codon:yes stop_codon:yes gene_type:complete